MAKAIKKLARAERGAGPTEKPTLKTIAKLSGLAVPTVSRALNDAPDIGATTKVLVRRIAKEIGYVPNRAGVRLRTGRTNVISLILSPEQDMMNHTAQLISSIAAELRNTPYHLIVTHFFQDEDPMRPVRYIVETGSADAIILNQTQPDDPRVRYLMEQKFPFATHGRTKWSDQHPYFDYDNAAYARIGVEELVRRGRRNLLLLAPPKEQNYAQNIIDGATEAANRLGAKLRVSKRVTSDESGPQVRAKVTEILSEDPTIDGILTSSPNSAMGAVGACEDAGKIVGKDVCILGKEAFRFLKMFRKEMLVVPEDVSAAGSFLARAALQAIREPEKPPMQGLEVPDSNDLII